MFTTYKNINIFYHYKDDLSFIQKDYDYFITNNFIFKTGDFVELIKPEFIRVLDFYPLKSCITKKVLGIIDYISLDYAPIPNTQFWGFGHYVKIFLKDGKCFYYETNPAFGTSYNDVTALKSKFKVIDEKEYNESKIIANKNLEEQIDEMSTVFNIAINSIKEKNLY